MTTAFQPSAFQNNAFQIDIDGGGGTGRKKLRDDLAKREIHALIERYKEAYQDLPKNEEVGEKITRTLSEYRKSKVDYEGGLLRPGQINFKKLYKNDSDLWRVVQLIAEIEEMRLEEELLLLLITIN